MAGGPVDNADYLVWIDADAMVLHHHRRFEEFVEAASGADFIVGEDMADTDWLNTGLFLVPGWFTMGCATNEEVVDKERLEMAH